MQNLLSSAILSKILNVVMLRTGTLPVSVGVELRMSPQGNVDLGSLRRGGSGGCLDLSER